MKRATIVTRDRAAESDDWEKPAENLSDLLGQVSKNSTGEIDSLIGEFERLRKSYRPMANAFNARLRNIKH
jgi:hypothetical protein